MSGSNVNNAISEKIHTNSVVVIGCNYCNLLTMARSLGQVGYSVEVIRVFKHNPTFTKPLRKMNPEARSKYTSGYSQCMTGGNSRAVVDYLLDYADDSVKLVVPVDDFVVDAIDNGYDELVGHYVLPCAQHKGGRIAELMNKSAQKRFAADAGLPVLKSYNIKSHNGDFTIPDDTPYPCFVKPNVSTRHAKSTMKKCRGPEELERHLKRHAKNGDFDMLVEEYADISNEYSILGFCYDGKAYSLGAIRIVEGGSRNRKGVALTGETVDVSVLGDIAQKCNRLVQNVDYNGMFDIDLIQTADGSMYFVEFNFRCGASAYAICKNGVNLPALYADRVMGGIEPQCIPDKKVSSFVSEKVLMEEFARGDADSGRIREAMSAADIFFVKDEEDPAPYRYYCRFYIVALMMRLIYKAMALVSKTKKSGSKNTAKNEDSRITAVVEITGRSRADVRDEMKRIKAQYGISFDKYIRQELYNYNGEELEEHCANLRDAEEKKHELLENILAAAQACGRDEASVHADMKTAKEKYGIGKERYYANNLYELEGEDFEKRCAEISKQKARKKQRAEKRDQRYLDQVVRATGWDEDYAREKMTEAKKNTGASFEHYAVYKFWDLDEETQKTFFCKGDTNRLRDKYNTDKETIRELMNKETFCKRFDAYLGRAWMSTNDCSYKKFIDTFGTEAKIIFKPSQSSGGKGIRVLEYNADNSQDVYKQIARVKNSIVESFLIQHHDMQKFSLNSVNTIRVATVTTYRDDIEGVTPGEVNILYAGLRVGQGKSYVDNLHSGGLMADINLDTGIIQTDGVDFANRVFAEHPDTHVRFKGTEIPYFEELKAMIKKAGAGIEGYFGWDVAIKEDGPVIIEVNTNPGPVCLQTPYVPLKIGKRYIVEKFL